MDPIQIEPGQRYLARINPKRIPHIFTDVLIIGGGIAGCRAALEIDPRLETIIVNKGKVTQSNSAYAQGGIAGVLDPLDNITNHVQDTLAAGKDLCDPELVEYVCSEAPRHIQELIEFGADFDTQDGKIALTKEGGTAIDASRMPWAMPPEKKSCEPWSPPSRAVPIFRPG
nr:FAD-dependent oxidoreductase [Gimesia benthica]